MTEITCPKCGGYVPGHASGAGDICTCEPMFTGKVDYSKLGYSDLKAIVNEIFEKAPKTYTP